MYVYVCVCVCVCVRVCVRACVRACICVTYTIRQKLIYHCHVSLIYFMNTLRYQKTANMNNIHVYADKLELRMDMATTHLPLSYVILTGVIIKNVIYYLLL